MTPTNAHPAVSPARNVRVMLLTVWSVLVAGTLLYPTQTLDSALGNALTGAKYALMSKSVTHADLVFGKTARFVRTATLSVRNALEQLAPNAPTVQLIITPP